VLIFLWNSRLPHFCGAPSRVTGGKGSGRRSRVWGGPAAVPLRLRSNAPDDAITLALASDPSDALARPDHHSCDRPSCPHPI
jgi:hypothetical protein